MNTSILARAAAAGSAAVALAFLAPATAAAHVTVSANTTEAGQYSVLTVGIPHGCDGASTTSVAIQIPEVFTNVTPTVNPNWEVEKVMERLDPPVEDGHGGERTERVAEVVYTANTPLPDDLRDTFELSVRLPETPGETLYFPAIQECEEGEVAWTQIAAEGQDASDFDYPAPAVTLTAASADDDGDTTAADTDSAGVSGLSVAALGLSAVAVVLGGAALVRTRRT
ncbi:YcnI family protein [Hoyosella subflava]|uniref:Nuclear export factor GLE1 n=1 Tax=Hoyosella subflava (strain DSM 45089 / JCM 17490 / NBRC 109087 / DQS3-9A1) TaxID=443218 RepID=F6ELQ2_HOYSD|nr:YcnI family protein [Hoyosella subflava]AEF41500.1 Nuclear export factor GLE1 [Hoyosella subflava DQS3-9A1]